MQELTVYTTPTCPWCSRVKEYLQSKGATYHEMNVATDDNAATAMINLTGQRSVPVLTTKDGEYVVGYNPSEIDKLLM